MSSIRDLSNAIEASANNNAPSCIVYPPPAEGREGDFELKGGLLHHLPKFHGLSNEDPHKHIKEFQFICVSLGPRNADPAILRLKAFPFTLEDRAKTWLLNMPPGHVTSWTTLVNEFLSKFFPASRVTVLRKQITGIQQGHDESFGTYYERFKGLIASCPSHGIQEGNLLQYFYEGLNSMDRQLLDAAAGGSFVDKTPAQAKDLLDNRAMNDYQYSGTSRETRQVKEAYVMPSLEAKLDTLIKHLAAKEEVKLCGLCQDPEHPTDQCPTLYNEESAKAMGYGGYNNNNNNNGYQNRPYQQQGQYQQRSNYPPRNQGNANQPPSNPPNAHGAGPTLAQILEMLTIGQQEQGKELTELKKQVGQLVDFMGKITQSGKLPSNTVQNPKNENASAVMTRSRRVLKDAEPTKEDESVGNKKNKAQSVPIVEEEEAQAVPLEVEEMEPTQKGNTSNFKSSVITNSSTRAPFPSRLKKKIKDEEDKEILEKFRKVEINMPLIDCITQIPKYKRVMKELCRQRVHTRERQVATMSETVSAVLRTRLPPKLKDPGSFSIPCTIGSNTFDNVMLDLGASINIIPHYLYAQMGLGFLKKDNVIIQLADHSQSTPLGYVEDVLVRVNHLIFPADFYVIEMEEPPNKTCPILLGRPFMRTARTKIDVYAGTLSMQIEEDKINFNVFEVMRST